VHAKVHLFIWPTELILVATYSNLPKPVSTDILLSTNCNYWLRCFQESSESRWHQHRNMHNHITISQCDIFRGRPWSTIRDRFFNNVLCHLHGKLTTLMCSTNVLTSWLHHWYHVLNIKFQIITNWLFGNS